MKRILVIGCPGSGKSTFSKALHETLGLPLYHLDLLYWNEDKSTVARPIFKARLAQILKEEQWIIDGNYQSTMEQRISASDTIFFLDFPMELCLEGVRARMGRPREDLPWIEQEHDEEFLDFIRNFKQESKPKILALLQKYSTKEIYILKTRHDAENFIKKATI